jgi:hypothetical protein
MAAELLAVDTVTRDEGSMYQVFSVMANLCTQGSMTSQRAGKLKLFKHKVIGFRFVK